MAGLSEAFTPQMSEFTTPGDLQRQRVSAAFGWDVGQPGQEFLRRLFTQLPLALRTAAPWMLSPNISRAPGQFTYQMLDPRGIPSGGVAGRMLGESPNQTANISWIGSTDHLENVLGPTGVRQLQRAFKQDFPGATTLTGVRVSGARRRALDENPDAIRSPDWRIPRVALPDR